MAKLGLGSHTVFTLLALGAVASAVACAKPEEEKKAVWRCNNADVPMGEVTRCTQLALGDVDVGWDAVTADYIAQTPIDNVIAPPTTTTPTTPPPTGDTGVSSSIDYPGWETYVCVPGSTHPDCAGIDDGVFTSPIDDTSVVVDTSNAGADTPTGGAGSTSSSSGGAPVGDTSSTGSASDGTKGNGNGGGAGTNGNGNGPKGDQGSSGKGPGPNGGSGGSSTIPGPDECAFVPDLPYCSGGGGSASSSSSSSSSGDVGDKGNGKGNGNASSSGAPGQEKKDDGASSSSSGGSSSSSGGGGGSNKGKSWKCIKDNKGHKACESVPSCTGGSHPSNGACVEDEPGTPPGETKPPSQGGCWITGGGFIVAPNDVTSAAADGHDNFGGNAKGMKDGSVKGHWNHVDHGTQNHAKGRPSYIYCRHVDEPGPGQPGGKKGFTMNQAYFGGPAEWRDAGASTWASGYWFDVVVKDHGEPGSVPHAKNGYMVDTYHFTIRKMDDPVNKVSGAVVYEVGRGGNAKSGGLVGGNIQLHPPNGGHPYTPGPLPSWVALEP